MRKDSKEVKTGGDTKETADREKRMITCLAVCGIDPKLNVSSCPEFVKDPQPTTDREKTIELAAGCFLRVSFNEVAKLPINDLEAVSIEINEAHLKLAREDWLPVEINTGEDKQARGLYREKSVNIKQLIDDRKNPTHALVLCYHCEEGTENAITDIAILKAEKGRGEQKSVFNIPQGYKMLNHTFSYKGRSRYLIYKRASSKLQLSYTPILLEKYPLKEENVVSLELLPHFCFPQGIHLSEEMRGFITFSFILSSDTRIFCSCVIIKQLLPSNLKKKLGLKQERVYFQKAICIVSQYSYPQEFCQILQHLYRISMSKNDVPFHVVVEELVNNLVMVEDEDMGKMAITYPYGGCSVVFLTNPRFPIASDKAIYSLCKFLSLPNIISLNQALLLEKQIFLISQSKTVISLITEALLAILFPFRWEHALIPILPETLNEYTEAIVPFIIGIPPSAANLDKQECIFIDLDHNQFINSEEMPPLPDKLQKQLAKRLQNYQYYVESDVQEYLENPENTYIFQMRTIDYLDFDPCDIRDAFLEFNASFMKNYNKFWNKNKKEALYGDRNEPLREINELFSVDDFLNDLNMTKIGSFGNKFTETSIFAHFIERRCRAPDDPYFLFFDECIEKKRKKKETRLITETKPQRFRVTPPPVWDTNKDKSYSYEIFPSIASSQGQPDLEEIDLEMEEYNEEESQKQTLFSKLLESHSVFKGFFQPIGLQIPYLLEKLNLQPEIQTLATQLLSSQNLAQFVEEISRMSDIKGMAKTSEIRLTDSRGFDVSKSRKDLRVLEIIDFGVRKQIRQIQDFKDKYFDSMAADTQKVIYRELAAPKHSSSNKSSNLVVETLMDDVKSIKGPNLTITFDNRRIGSHLGRGQTNIVIHNTTTKHMLNRLIHCQPRLFFRFVVETVRQEQVVWLFSHFLQLRAEQG